MDYSYKHTLRPQLCTECYIIKSIQGLMGSGLIRSLYKSKFELLIRHGIIFWGVENESISIFKLQKRVVLGKVHLVDNYLKIVRY
jgi:hypothetical protein